MNPKAIENLRQEFRYYQEFSEDGQPCVPWDDWEYVAWQYIQKLEQEVLKLRDQLAEVQKGYAESIEARAGGNKCPYP